MQSVGNPWLWCAFFVVVCVMLLVDLVALKGGKAHRVSLKEAAAWSCVWIALALAFNAGAVVVSQCGARPRGCR